VTSKISNFNVASRRFKLRSIHVESQRHPNFVVIDELCRNAKRSHFYVRKRDILDKTVATIKPINLIRNFFHLSFVRILIDITSWIHIQMLASVRPLTRTILFIIGEHPDLGLMCEAPRGHVASHITNDVMHQHIHVCRRIN